MVRLDVLVRQVLADAREKMDKRKAGAGDEPSPGRMPRDGKGGTSLAGGRPGADVAIPARRFVVHPKGGDRALTGRPGGQRG